MPWTPKEAKTKKKGLSKKESAKWASIANAVLEKSGDEGKAIRIASSRTKKGK
jgi:uncharacterized protein YdaT